MIEPATALAVIQAAATLAMTGLIWFVQVVHYPLFRRVGERGFATYEEDHARLTSLLVGPLMLIEAASAVALTALMPQEPLVWIGMGLLITVWLSTFTLQVPQHRQLARGFDGYRHRRLVRTNWIRTLAWSARSVVVLVLLTQI